MKATYVLYLGWFDGNPATLDKLPPVEASKKYVEFMGGADEVLEKGEESYAKGEYRWVARWCTMSSSPIRPIGQRENSRPMRSSNSAIRRSPGHGATSI